MLEGKGMAGRCMPRSRSERVPRALPSRAFNPRTQVVECFRRVALTGLAVFIYPDSSAQIAIVLILAVLFMVVSGILSPFSQPVEMWLYRAGNYVVFASMYLALLLRVDVSDENSQSQEVRRNRAQADPGVVICGGEMCRCLIVAGLRRTAYSIPFHANVGILHDT